MNSTKTHKQVVLNLSASDFNYLLSIIMDLRKNDQMLSDYFIHKIDSALAESDFESEEELDAQADEEQDGLSLYARKSFACFAKWDEENGADEDYGHDDDIPEEDDIDDEDITSWDDGDDDSDDDESDDDDFHDDSEEFD